MDRERSAPASLLTKASREFLIGLYLLTAERDADDLPTQIDVGQYLGQDVAETPIRVAALFGERLIEDAMPTEDDPWPNPYTDMPLRLTEAGRRLAESLL